MAIWRWMVRRWREDEEMLSGLKWLGPALSAELHIHRQRDFGGAFKAE